MILLGFTNGIHSDDLVENIVFRELNSPLLYDHYARSN